MVNHVKYLLIFIKVGTTCNTAVVMAKLVLDGVDQGIHAFIVPLRSPETHKPFPSLFVFCVFFVAATFIFSLKTLKLVILAINLGLILKITAI
jgi:hypothetical protein